MQLAVFCCSPALDVLLKAPRGLGSWRLITFLFRLSKLKTAQKKPSSRNQLISFNIPTTTHTAPTLIIRGHSPLISALKISPSHRLKTQNHCSFFHLKIDLLIQLLFDGKPKQLWKEKKKNRKGPVLSVDACGCCLEVWVVKSSEVHCCLSGWCLPPGHRRETGKQGNRHRGLGKPRPPLPQLPLLTTSCCCCTLAGAGQRQAFTAEKPQRRRRLIRVKQAIESG